MTMKIETFDLPDFWGSALINGDYSGLNDDDEKSINAFTDWMVKEYGSCWCLSVADNDSGDFRTYHDARQFGVLACDVSEYSFDVTKR